MKISQRIVIERRTDNKVLLERVIPRGQDGNKFLFSILNRFADERRYRRYFSTDIQWGR